MLRTRLFGALFFGMAVLGLPQEQERPVSTPLEPDTEAWVAQPVAPTAAAGDTLRPSVEAGEPLLLALPAELGDQPVDRYALIQGPALSGVADASFTWITQAVAPGSYEVLLRAVRSEAPPDTLVLQVRVQE